MMLLTRPDFPVDRLEERRRQALARLNAAPTATATLVRTELARELAPGSASARLAHIGSAAEINSITRADLQAAFDRWVRPQGAKLFITSNDPLAALLPQLNATLGQWTATGKGPAGKAVPRVQATTAGTPRIVLIDMPDAVQASIAGGQLLAIPYRDEAMAANVANITLGGGFLSRINMNLREDKHWSYGASGGFENDELRSSYRVNTEVQPDKVGAAIAEVRKEVNDTRSTRPITQAEFDQGKANLLRKRVADYRTGVEMLWGAKTLADKGWPDDFYTKYDDRLNALTLAQANAELMLAVAQAFVDRGTPPKRSVMFAALTSEETGMRGSDYLARNPVVPTGGRIIADVNLDMPVLLFKGTELKHPFPCGTRQISVGKRERSQFCCCRPFESGCRERRCAKSSHADEASWKGAFNLPYGQTLASMMPPRGQAHFFVHLGE